MSSQQTRGGYVQLHVILKGRTDNRPGFTTGMYYECIQNILDKENDKRCVRHITGENSTSLFITAERMTATHTTQHATLYMSNTITHTTQRNAHHNTTHITRYNTTHITTQHT